MLLGVIAGCGGGYDHKVGLIQQLLIKPNPNTAGHGNAGRDDKESSNKAQFELFHV
jgi:hypothetical protein